MISFRTPSPLYVVLLATTLAFTQSAETPISAKALAIQDSAIVVDTHADTPQRFLDEGFDIGSTDPNDVGHLSLDKARRGNLGAEFFSIWVDPETNQGHFAPAAVGFIDSVYEQCVARRSPDTLADSIDHASGQHPGPRTGDRNDHFAERGHTVARRDQRTPRKPVPEWPSRQFCQRRRSLGRAFDGSDDGGRCTQNCGEVDR